MSSSFKTEFRQRPVGFRTPSPPREAYEIHYTEESRWTDTGQEASPSGRKRKLKVNDKHDSQAISNGKVQSQHHSTNSEHLKEPSTGQRLSSRRPGVDHQFHNSQSPLDVFATVATSPNLGNGVFQHYNPGSPPQEIFFKHGNYGNNGMIIGHAHRANYGKHSRVDQFDQQSYNYHSPRPMTSNSSHDATGSNTAREDAELLLSLSRGDQLWQADSNTMHSPLPITAYTEPPAPLALASPHPEKVEQASSEQTAILPVNFSPSAKQNDMLPDVELPLVEGSEPNKTSAHVEEPHDMSPLAKTEPSLIDGALTEPDVLPAPLPYTASHQDVDSAKVDTPADSTAEDSQSSTAETAPSNALHAPADDVSNGTPEMPADSRQRVYKGWPKGKPRGPRQVPYAKRGTKRIPKQVISKPSSGDGVDEGMLSGGYESRTGSLMTLSSQLDRRRLGEPQRRRSLSTMLPNSHTTQLYELGHVRSKSVPPDVPMVIHPKAEPRLTRSETKTGKPPTTTAEINLCAACYKPKNGTNGYMDLWIACNACGNWFHHTCVGFKTEREVRNIDKFHCDACQPQHGPTTFVRKSGRAHASVDYAGLHEGKIRTATDIPDHHYIKAFMDGTIQFQPESFPRMRPEFVTADYFEKCSAFTEPVVIPAWMNSHNSIPALEIANLDSRTHQQETGAAKDNEQFFSSDFEYDCITDNGQDKLDMVIPEGLTVRRVTELYGPEEKVAVIDVKSQEGEDKRWNMRKWAAYYEATGEKPVRNVISLEVSQSKLGKLIQRPKAVRDLDLQDWAWPADETAKGIYPKVQFYCLMSVANCYTDFHIDFGGSSVYYHIIRGKKTFFFIPPKKQHLKKYEDWCLSSNQSSTWLGDETKECYRVDLSDGDTMLIPSGWIHAVWTPCDTLVIGGNFLTRMHYGMQIQIVEIEKNTHVQRQFKYPYFQKVMWCAVLKYLEDDPVPSTVVQRLLNSQAFERKTPTYFDFDPEHQHEERSAEAFHARYYSQSELDGLPDLLSYIFRTVLISLGKLQGISKTTQEAVIRSMPKGRGEHLELAQTFATWIAWKRGNEELPSWAYPDAVIEEEELANSSKKISAAAVKRLERQAAHEAFKQQSSRRSSARQVPLKEQDLNTATPAPSELQDMQSTDNNTPSKSKLSTTTSRRPACDACRKRRIRCKHKEFGEELPEVSERFGVKQVTTTSVTMPVSEDLVLNDTPLPVKVEDMSSHQAPSSQTLVAVVINSAEKRKTTDSSYIQLPVTEHTLQLSAEVEGTGELTKETMIQEAAAAAKRARTRACDECRKSKRRCIHDENGQVDPVKASENPTSRTNNGAKRSRSDSDTARQPEKKPKHESEEQKSAFAIPGADAVDGPTTIDPAPLEEPLVGPPTMKGGDPQIGDEAMDISTAQEPINQTHEEAVTTTESPGTADHQVPLDEPVNDESIATFTAASPAKVIDTVEPMDIDDTQPTNVETYDPAHLPAVPGTTDIPHNSVDEDEDELANIPMLYNPDRPIFNAIDHDTHDQTLQQSSPPRQQLIGRDSRDGTDPLQDSRYDYNAYRLTQAKTANANAMQMPLSPAALAALRTFASSQHLAHAYGAAKNEIISTDAPEPPTSNDTLSRSGADSYPSTPPMSPLTPLGTSPLPEVEAPTIANSKPSEPRLNANVDVEIKPEPGPTATSTVVYPPQETEMPRSLPRQRKQTERFSDEQAAAAQEPPPAATITMENSRTPSSRSRQSSVVSPRTVQKSTSGHGQGQKYASAPNSAGHGRKREGVRSLSGPGDFGRVGSVGSVGGGDALVKDEVIEKTEKELREERDGKLARELSGLDFGLRRRSK